MIRGRFVKKIASVMAAVMVVTSINVPIWAGEIQEAEKKDKSPDNYAINTNEIFNSRIDILKNGDSPYGSLFTGRYNDGNYYEIYKDDDDVLTLVIKDNPSRVENKWAYYANPYSDNIKHVVIAEGVTEILDNLITGFPEVEDVSIPATLTKYSYIKENGNDWFPYGPFGLCGKLAKFNIASGNTRFSIGEQGELIYDEEGNGENKILLSFPPANTASTYTVPDGITEIGCGAFSGCSNLQKIILNNSVSSIKESAFNSCSNLETIDMTSKVSEIPQYCFELCTSLKSIKFPSNLQSINRKAFSRCTMNTFRVPKGVTSLSYSFLEDSSVKKLILPKSLTYFGTQNSGYGDYSNIDIYYCGSEEEWNAIYGSDKIGYSSITYNYVDDGNDDNDDDDDDDNNNDDDDNKDTITISFNSMGGTIVRPKEIKIGETVNEPEAPTKNGAEFMGWYTDNTYTTKVDFSRQLHSNTEYFAAWKSITVSSVINARGYGIYDFVLRDKYGRSMSLADVSYYRVNPGEDGEIHVTRTKTDSMGNVRIKTDLCELEGDVMKERNSFPHETQTIRVSYNEDGEEKTFDILFNITIEPLSFAQTFSGIATMGAEVSYGGVGGSLGTVEIEANAAEVKVKGEKESIFSGCFNHSNGNTELTLTDEYNPKIGIAGSIGHEAHGDILGLKAEMEGWKVEGGGDFGLKSKIGMKIKDYTGSKDDLTKTGKFLLASAAFSSGNAFLLHICDKLGWELYNIEGEGFSTYTKVGASIGSLGIKTEKGKSIADGKLADTEYQNTFSYEVETDRSSDNTKTLISMKKDSAIGVDIGSVGVGNPEWKKKAKSGEVEVSVTDDLGWGKSFFSKEFLPQRYKLNYSADKNKTFKEFRIEEQTEISSNGLPVLYNKVWESKEVFSYKNENANNLFKEVSTLENYKDGKVRFILDTIIQGINETLKTLPVEADYTEELHKKVNWESPTIKIGAKLKLGIKGFLSFLATEEWAAVRKNGKLYAGEITVNSENDIEELVNNKKINGFNKSLEDAFDHVIDLAKGVIKKATGTVRKAAYLFLCDFSFLDPTAEIKYHLVIWAVDTIEGIVSSTFFVINTYGSDRIDASLCAVGDELKGTAYTIGSPYYVAVTEEDDETIIDDFSDTPAVIKLSYTDEMLSNIGASSEDEKNIEMFRYDEDKCGYISVGGEVDEEKNSVRVTITEPGQFILAINTELLPVETEDKDKTSVSNNTSLLSQTLAKTSSKTFTAGSDTYTVSWNSFVQFDGRKHNGVGTDASGNPVGAKESGKKVCDLKLSITRNGELVDPGKYTVKAKNNRNATVSIDGITAIQDAKTPSFKLKFKGKEFKAANAAAKNETFDFGIVPVELKQDAVTFDKVKTGKDGSIQIKKMTFKPESASSVASKPIKMKYKNQQNKTDYVTETMPDGSMRVIGKNNFYGSVEYKK